MIAAGRVKITRKRPQLRAALDYLDICGATDVTVLQKGHVRIRWTANGRSVCISLSSTPTSEDNCKAIARQLIRRRYKEAGVEIRA